MSIIVPEEFECDKCHRKIPFTMIHSFNTALNPELKEDVLNLKAFRIRCPDCGQETLLKYNFLYHDMTRQYMIKVIWDRNKLSETDPSPLKKIFPENQPAEYKYRFRKVFGYWQMLEKIRIFDAELNDYAVEVIKSFIRRKAHIPDDLELRFTGVRDGELIYTASNDSSWSCSLEQYSGLLEHISTDIPPENDFVYVDESIFGRNSG